VKTQTKASRFQELFVSPQTAPVDLNSFVRT